MNKVDIYYFSGTGNTMHIVNTAQSVFKTHSIECSLFPITNETSQVINFDNTIGIACPVAVWSTYTLVWDFINNLPKTSNKTKVFLIATFAKHDGWISGQIYKVLKTKGYEVIGYSGVIMPSNFMVRTEDKVKDAAIILRGEEKITGFISNLIDCKTNFAPSNFLLATFGFWMYKIFLSTGLFQKIFKVEIIQKICVKCGVCKELCPVNNIECYDNKYKVGNGCQECMRCFAFCPRNAIKVKISKQYSACTYKEFKKELNDQ